MFSVYRAGANPLGQFETTLVDDVLVLMLEILCRSANIRSVLALSACSRNMRTVCACAEMSRPPPLLRVPYGTQSLGAAG